MTIRSIFKKIFGGKDKTLANRQPATVDRNLFTDPNSPLLQTSTDTLVATEPTREKRRPQRTCWRPTAITDFLSINFWQTAYNQAMQFPNVDRRESAMKSIRAQYRQALQDALIVVEKEVADYELQKIAQQGISEVIDLQLKRRSQELDTHQQTISRQLELSIDDEGWLATVVAQYNDGFTEGSMQYLRVNDILGGITGVK
jgi:hypothetical protein